MGYPWATHGLLVGGHGMPMGYPWATHGLPGMTMDYSWATTHGMPWEAHGMPMECRWGANGLLVESHVIPIGYPRGTYGLTV